MSVVSSLFGDRNSLRRNLVTNIVLALLFSLLLASVILIREFYEHLRENMEAALAAEAAEIADQIDPQAEGFGLHGETPRFQGNQGLYSYTVFDQDGALLAGSEDNADIRARIATMTPGVPVTVYLPNSRVGVILGRTVQGRDWYVLVSTLITDSQESQIRAFLDEAGEKFHWIVLGVIVVLASAYLATRRSLRPLVRVSAQAHDIGPNSTGKRLSTDHLPAEIVPLVGAVNGAFDRLDKGYRAQRDFSSNVAHEVRTPLAVLRSSIDRIEDETLRRDLKQDVQRLDQMFEQLIDLSRAEALGPASFEPVDLHDIAVGLASDLASDALRSGRSLAVTGAGSIVVNGHPGLLSIALGNLVRNALNYSPEGTEVEIEILADPPGWKVLDRGPGVPEAQKPHLFERFNRGAAQKTQIKGSGIGLAIVKSVADAHGATVRIKDRQGGGSEFIFEFDA